jgi:hypothetical protein
MHKMMVPLAGIGLMLTLTDTAPAAPPAYCALYAREFAKSTVGGRADGTFERTLDQAFYKCLNLDVEPAFPEGSAYLDGGIGETDALAADQTEVAGGGVGVGPTDDTIAPVAEGDAEMVETAQNEAPPRSRSGLEPWSPKWQAWCEEHFPNSFNPKTGMVIPLEGGKSFC